MKKKFLAMAMAVALLTGCATMGGNSGGLFGGIDGASVLGNVLGSVLGLNKVTQENLVGTWRYAGPGCAFTSDNLLAKAGGEVASQKIKSQLQTYYNNAGINASNTYFTFSNDNKFSGKVAGKTVSGAYTYDPSTGQMTIKTLLFTINAYVTASTNGISLLFESQKLLTILQTVGAMSGNSSLATIGELSKNYDGVRLGFDLSR